VAKSLGKVLAEFVGTGLLVAVVVGSGIVGSSLSQDAGVALLINAFSTVFALALLIYVVGPISGAHFNPAVTIVELATKKLAASQALLYIAAQILGAIGGSILANVMFNQAAIQFSTHARISTGTFIGEVLAPAGLLVVIGVLSHRGQVAIIPVAVAGWIGSAYFFTSSTSFANPAVTIGRVFTNTFAGIAPDSVMPFIAAQLIGALIGMLVVRGVARG
jgi:glycerol uptake facilitator-like aquaporin